MENQELVNVEQEESNVLSFGNMRKNSDTEVSTYSNIQDKKKLFNLQSHVDYILNECVGDTIRVKEVLIRKYEKPLKEAVVDEETGEILKDKEVKVSCVLVDDNGKSYATGSKSFVFNLMSYLGDFDGYKDLENGIEMKIIKVPVPDSSNKALGFEIL